MRDVPPVLSPQAHANAAKGSFSSRFWLLGLFAGALLSGCFGNRTDAFPADLKPLEENLAKDPEAVEGDPHPEQLSLFDGATENFHLVHARGYVKAPLADVYDAVRTPEAVADRRKVDSWEYKDDAKEVTECADLPTDIKYCFRIDNVVDDLITVKFHVTWRFGDIVNEKGDVVGHVGRWQKTWGSEVIELLEGSVMLTPVTDDVTEVALIEHLDAFSGSRENALSYVKDYYANIVALSHNEPVPTY